MQLHRGLTFAPAPGCPIEHRDSRSLLSGDTLDISTFLIFANSASTLYLIGLIWVVQLVHYPLFADVGGDRFVRYQHRHQILMTVAVGPAMLIEAFSSVFLVWYLPANINPDVVLTGVGLVLLIWISTAAIQVPCHHLLSDGFDPKVHRRLVNSNWIRTVAWTARGVLVIGMLVNVLNAS